MFQKNRKLKKTVSFLVLLLLVFPFFSVLFAYAGNTPYNHQAAFSSNFSGDNANTSWGVAQPDYGPIVNGQLPEIANTTQILYNTVDTNGNDLGTATFVNQSNLTPLDAGYCYIRMTAEQSASSNAATPSLGSSEGMTIEFSANFDGLPVNEYSSIEGDILQDYKCGQTGFVINIRTAHENREFYFCIFGVSKNAAGETTQIRVSNYACDRDAINTTLPEYSDVITIEPRKFHKFTFVFNRALENSQEPSINVYVDGSEKGSFSRPTYGRNDNPQKNFVCISSVNRPINGFYENNNHFYTNSLVHLNYINIYNEPIVPASLTLPTPLYGQQTGVTCGYASARMVLASLGYEFTEEEMVNFANAKYTTSDGTIAYHTGVEYVQASINNALAAAGAIGYDGKLVKYSISYDISTTDQLLSRVQTNLLEAKPIIVLLRTGNAIDYFGHSSEHFVVINGIYNSEDDSNPFLEILDPWRLNSPCTEYSGQLVRIPLNELFACFSSRGSIYFI